MTGLSQFLNVFGNITVLHVVEFIFAITFIFVIGKKFTNYLIKIHEANEEKDKKLNKALDAVEKYPEYRRQSIEIQQKLEDQIQGLRDSQDKIMKRLDEIEETRKNQKRNELRDRLLQSYRYYTNKDANPSQTWTKMESEAFWELFKDYELAGGNGYMHTEVQPAMNKLIVIDMR